MQAWQSTFLGIRQLPKDLSAFEMQAFFTFSNAELELIQARRADTHKLGLELHIGFLRLSGRLLDAKRMVSATLWRHLVAQLGVASPELASLKALCAREATLMEHQRMACDVLEFTWMSEHQRRALVRMVRDEVARSGDTVQLMRFARHWLYGQKLLIPHDRALRSIITNALSALDGHRHVPAGHLGLDHRALRQTTGLTPTVSRRSNQGARTHGGGVLLPSLLFAGNHRSAHSHAAASCHGSVAQRRRWRPRVGQLGHAVQAILGRCGRACHTRRRQQ